jgi:uncharacterized damage-inducible protein DinB
MNAIEMYQAQLDAEARRTRRALERVPEGKGDWKPHDTSMPLGRLAFLVAGMPAWIALVVNRDELDLNPPGGGSAMNMKPLNTAAELVEAMEGNVVQAREALAKTNEAHLKTPWKLLVSGKVVAEDPRSTVIRDTFMHLAHHRGQLTVYLRMCGQPVPAIYGPSADENRFD